MTLWDLRPVPLPLPQAAEREERAEKGEPTIPEGAKRKTGACDPICIGFNDEILSYDGFHECHSDTAIVE